MGTIRCMARYLKIWLTLLLLFVAVVAEAATVSGTVTNSSGIAGRVYVGLITEWGDIQQGVSVQTVGATPTAFAIKGVPNGSYTLAAYVDRTGTGFPHVNDPRTMGATGGVVVTGGNVAVGDVNLAAPGGTVPPITPAAPGVLPIPGGALILWEGDTDQYGGLYADAFDISCNGGAIVRNNVPNPTMVDDNFSLVVLTGLANGSSLSCTVTPKVKGVAYTPSQASVPVTIGDSCGAFGTCSSGVTVSGRINFSGFPSLAGKTLLAVLSDWNSDVVYAVAIQNPSASQSYSIPGVPPSPYAWRTEFMLFDTAAGYVGQGTVGVNERDESARLMVDGGEDVVAPDVTLKSRNSGVTLNVVGNFSNSGDTGYSFAVDYGTGLKRPVNLTLNNDSGTGLPAEGFSSSIVNSPWIQVTSGFNPGNTYAALFEYSDGSMENIPLEILKGAVDAHIRQSFPVGQVRIPDLSNPVAGWSYSTIAPQIPGTVTSTIQAPGFNWIENLTTATNWFIHDSVTPLVVGNEYGVSTQFEDMLGDKTATWNSFTPMASGPLITSLDPATGGSGATVTITGSGFTGATAVAFNGIAASFTVVDGSHITATVPSGAARGPVTVTTGGITGISTTPFEKTATISGKLTNSAGSPVNGITVSTIGAGTPLSTTTNATGDYILTLPAGIPLYLKIHDASGTYRDMYARFLAYTGTVTGNDNVLYTDTDFGAWEARDSSFTAVKNGTAGMIRARVTRNNGTPLDGVTLTVRSRNYPKGNPAYKIIYADTGNLPDPVLTSTSSSGRYFVTGIEQGDTVAVFAEKNGYGFIDNFYQVFNGSIGAGRLHGEPMATATLSPPGGDIAAGAAVTVTLDQPGTFYYTYDCCGTSPDPRYFGAGLQSGGTITMTGPDMDSIKYVVKNASGVFSEPVVVTYNVIQDLTPPDVTITPAPNSPYPPNYYYYTSSLPVTATFSANEPATIYYTTNGSTPTTSSPSVVIANPGGSASIQITQNSILKFFGKDTAGNQSFEQLVTYVLDATPPVINSVDGGGLKNSRTFSVAINTSDNLSGVSLFMAKATNSTPSGSDPAWSSQNPFNVTVGSDGPFTYYAFVKDVAGNVSAPFAFSFTVDTVPPVAPVVSAPAAGATLAPTPTISGTAEAGSTVKVKVGANVVGTAVATNGSFSITTSPLALGPVNLDVTATDAAGNVSAATARPVTIAASSVKVGAKEFLSIQSAYSDAATVNSAILKVKAGTLTENDTFNKSIAVTLDGGYNDTYGSVTGTTKVKGKLLVRAGTVRVKKMAVY